MLTSLALVVVVVIDQFRTDELLRAHQILNPAGIGRLVDQGIFYDDAHHTQFFNKTCPGHTAISTGAQPGLHGIMGNYDWDSAAQKPIYWVSDTDHHWIDADADLKDFEMGTSPKRILTTTVGDELKNLWPESRVVSVAPKDRAAIAMGGHRADGVYWFAPHTEIWTTSDFYQPSKKLPSWLEKFNKADAPLVKAQSGNYESSTQAVFDTVDVALAAADAEKLGTHKKPDMLWVSFSTHDIVSHTKGDDSAELKKILKAEDDSIAKLITQLQKKMGSKKILVVFTADHGAGVDVEHLPNIPGGKMDDPQVKTKLNQCLLDHGITGKDRKPLAYLTTGSAYLSSINSTPQARGTLKTCLESLPGVWRAYTKDEILEGKIPNTPWLQYLPSAFHPARGADAVIIFDPYWNSSKIEPINHETSYDYDSWVPLAFWWPGIKKMQVHHRVHLTSLAPTLARILETRRPSGAMDDYLTEVLDALP